MPADAFRPALRAALRENEIGSHTPYEISFASKGKSGGSFGFMQGDLAASQPDVTKTFETIMTKAGATPAQIRSWIAALSVHCVSNPLSRADTAFIDKALVTYSADVDAMDDLILKSVYAALDDCISTAGQYGRRISPKALLYAALWINMTGYPNKMLRWLSGGDPELRAPVAPAPALVRATDIRAYLSATDYFIKNSKNMGHMDESVQVGSVALPNLPYAS